jgi:glycosyltransferase EpsD
LDVKYNLNFERNPLSFKNLKVYFKLKQIINDNKYEIIHCHTPIGGALTRLASKKARKDGCNVNIRLMGSIFLMVEER